MISPDHKPCAATCCNGQPRKIGTLFCERHQSARNRGSQVIQYRHESETYRELPHVWGDDS
jgi:hypothetical protein